MVIPGPSRTASTVSQEALLRYLLDEIGAVDIRDDAGLCALDERIHRRTGIRRFFPDRTALDRFVAAPSEFPARPEAPGERQWGDFQTPPWLAAAICALLADEGVAPRVVVEPTYGLGSFVGAALDAFPSARLIYGVEIQERYEWELKLRLAREALAAPGPHAATIELHRDDIFSHRFADHVTGGDDLLIIGNPPWVTNAELGVLSSGNRPQRRNLRSLHGLAALTGKSNFDLAECVILRMLEQFGSCRGWLAMLCKSAVVRNIIELLPRGGLSCRDARAYAIDAAEAFDVAVDASLLVMRLGSEADEISDGAASGSATCRVLTLREPGTTVRTFGWSGGKFVADVDLHARHAFMDGASPMVWRQGIKHDCAAVMELRRDGEAWTNGLGERVDIEAERIYPLLKSSDLRGFTTEHARRALVVTQQGMGEDTAALRESAPRLWAYLEAHAPVLAARRSSIYRKAPPFALFGIGPYSFKPYKVGIAGLYKRARFSLIAPIDGRPAMLDDTCYFLGFDAHADALFTASLLNHPIVLGLLDAIVFPQAKRPYTKAALMRIDLAEAAERVSFEELRAVWNDHGYAPPADATEDAYGVYRDGVRSWGKSLVDGQ